MERIDKHMEQQNRLFKRMNEQLKTGASQYGATSNKEIRPVHEKSMQDVTQDEQTDCRILQEIP
jgi:hypothetical protein